MTVPLMILRIVVDTWVNSYPVSWHWSANLIVGALPMVCLGYIIADQKEKLALIPAWKLIVCCLVSAAAMFLTSIFSVGRLNISQPFKILCGASLFVLCINNPQRHLCRFVESCGRHDSLLVYLSHFLILIIVSELMYSMPHLPKHMDWIVPLTVAAVSLVFARIVSIVILHYYKCHCRGP